MRRERTAACVAIAVALAAAGCGSSGSGTTAGGSTAKRAIEAPVQSRGIKGENPTTEAATDAHLSAADCKALAALAERQTGARLTRKATPKPPLSKCSLSAHGISVNIYLDAGFAAAQRYHNRIDETVQFNTRHPSGLPQPVPHVGEKAPFNSDAGWIPALGSLLAVRGNRWLTVTISVAGATKPQQRDQAAALAIAGFRLTAET